MQQIWGCLMEISGKYNESESFYYMYQGKKGKFYLFFS